MIMTFLNQHKRKHAPPPDYAVRGGGEGGEDLELDLGLRSLDLFNTDRDRPLTASS